MTPAPRPRPELPDREAQALAEMAATRVSRPAATATAIAFAATLLLGAASELVPLEGKRVSPRVHRPIVPISWQQLGQTWRNARWRGVDYRIRLLLGSIRNRFERDGAFSRLVRPRLQWLLLKSIRYGNSQVLASGEGWLFYQRPFNQVVGAPLLSARTLERRARPGWRPYPAAHPDPVPGLLRLKKALGRRGARLVLVPIPEKEQVYPERLRPMDWKEPPVNPDYDELVSRLETGGLPVFDATRLLFRAARSRDDLWSREDAHWTPAGLDLTAAGLADFLKRRFGDLPGDPVRFGRRRARLRLVGDLANLLGFALDDGPRFGLEFEATEILEPDGRPFLATRAKSPILLVGDSFARVFQISNGSPQGAGLAEHLALHAQRRVSQIVSHLQPDLKGRIALLSRSPEKVRAARIVLYEVATRGLGTYDWEFVPLPGKGPKRPRLPSRRGGAGSAGGEAVRGERRAVPLEVERTP